jgi:hypothetical protein
MVGSDSVLPQLTAEIRAAGFHVDSVSQLRTSGRRYRQAVPILLRWLAIAKSTSEKEEIVRALSVPWAKPDALAPLILEFRKTKETLPGGQNLRWAIGNAIEVLWDDSMYDQLAKLAGDPSFGKAREMVVLGLAKSSYPGANALLSELTSDPDVYGHAVMALARCKPPAAPEVLQRFSDDPKAWVRKEVRRALKSE